MMDVDLFAELMMPTVWIPPLLRDLTGGQATIEVAGATVRETVNALDSRFPGLKARLCSDDRLRPGIAVIIDAQVARDGLDAAVALASEVHFVPGIAGGESAESGVRIQESGISS
jgi:molybdopterin converting factor small subunit